MGRDDGGGDDAQEEDAAEDAAALANLARRARRLVDDGVPVEVEGVDDEDDDGDEPGVGQQEALAAAHVEAALEGPVDRVAPAEAVAAA